MATESSDDSVSPLLAGLRAGDAVATGELTRRYFERVVRAAAKRLPKGRPLRGTDAEDIAASVFESLWGRAAGGRFSKAELSDQDELWRLLCKMTASKVIDHARRERAIKRGGGEVCGESVFTTKAAQYDSAGLLGIAGVADSGFAPDELAAFAESQERLLAMLPEDRLREIAVMRLEGFDVKDIAAKFNLTDRSIKRKLAIIRDEWASVLDGRN